MPFSHTISEEKQVAYVTAHGAINLRASVEAISNLAKDPNFHSHFRVIVDMRQVEYSPSTYELSGLADALGSKKDSFHGRVAIVGPENALFVGRLACLIAGVAVFKMKVFTDRANAEEYTNSLENNTSA